MVNMATWKVAAMVEKLDNLVPRLFPAGVRTFLHACYHAVQEHAIMPTSAAYISR